MKSYRNVAAISLLIAAPIVTIKLIHSYAPNKWYIIGNRKCNHKGESHSCSVCNRCSNIHSDTSGENIVTDKSNTDFTSEYVMPIKSLCKNQNDYNVKDKIEHKNCALKRLLFHINAATLDDATLSEINKFAAEQCKLCKKEDHLYRKLKIGGR